MYAGGAAAYNANASQFAGGGFMPSQEAPDARAGSSAQKKNYDAKDSTLRALTVKQLSEAAQSLDDQMTLDGKPVSNFTVLGKIVHVEEQQLLSLYTIDDGTGRIRAKYWTPDNDDEFDRQRRAEWREGVYVRAYGHMTSVGREKSMVAFNLRTITDFNELTYHYLQCIFQHLHLTKGSGAGSSAGFVKPEPAAAGGMAAPVAAAPAGAAFGGYNPNAGMNGCQEEVLKLLQSIEAQNSEHGFNIEQIVEKLGRRYNVGQVKQAIDFLSNEGHLYSTIDEQHFKSCTY